MNWLDIAIIIIVLIPTYIGFRRGLIGTVIPLLGIILAIVFAGIFYDSVAGWLSGWLDSQSQANIVGFIIIFTLVLLASMSVAFLLRSFLSLLLLGWLDKLGGFVFGLLIGAVFSSVLLSIMSKFFASTVEETVADSALASFFLDKLPFVLLLLPNEFDSVRQFFS
jgi:membrane protein required for colicin V production